MDRLDRKILRLLQEDATLAVADIAKKVGLSTTPCWRRIRKMQEAGIIKGRVVLLDAERIGLDVSIFVFIKLERHSEGVLDEFEAAVSALPEVLQCHSISGEFDFILRVVVGSVRDYEKTVKGKLLKLPNVGVMNSHFALSEIKNTTALPI